MILQKLLGVGLLLLLTSTGIQSQVVVLTSQGSLRGTTLTSARSNTTFFAFMGIPYAQPPVGNLRFKDPQPAITWNGTRDATTEGAPCPQRDPYSSMYIGEEDCLFLNVYTPQLPSEHEGDLKAVMLWIHGGGWHLGNGGRYNNGPDYLIQEDVVIVVINYRLGALGFLSLPEAGLHGNYGLKDQVMAMKWIRQNIAQFSGDPNKVTIFGTSAGAASVNYHMISPMSQGLFERAILQSGSALNYWALSRQDLNTNYTFTLGRRMGHNTTDLHHLVQMLRTENPERLVNLTIQLNQQYMPNSNIPFHPIVDSTAPPGEVFLPDNPRTIIQEGRFRRISIIAGVNSREGLWELTNIRNAMAWNNINLEDIPEELGIELKENRTVPVTVDIRHLYFGNNSVSNASLDQHIDLSGDLTFVIGVYLVAKKQGQFSTLPVYFYEFSYSGGMSIFKKLVGADNTTGSCHMDDSAYLFKSERVNQTFDYDSLETKTSRRIVKLWTNFAKTGNPTPQPDHLLQNVTWSSITQNDVTYLDIGDELVLRHGYKSNRMNFWEALFEFNATSS